MTTLVIAHKNGQIAIAADSQTTFGDTRLTAEHDAASNKIFRFHEHYIAISGSAAHDLVLQNALQALGEKKVDFSSRAAIFATLVLLHPILKEQFFLKPDEDEDDPYESSQMSVLIANKHGIFGVYSLREVYQYQRFWAAGSGREFAIGAMFAAYETKETAAEIADIGVRAGIAFDINSAAPITAYTV